MVDPSNTNGDSNSVTGSKKLLYGKLFSEINKLSNSIQKLDDNVKVTAEQMPSFIKMGTYHGAMFMSVNSVLNEPKPSNNTTR